MPFCPGLLDNCGIAAGKSYRTLCSLLDQHRTWSHGVLGNGAPLPSKVVVPCQCRFQISHPEVVIFCLDWSASMKSNDTRSD